MNNYQFYIAIIVIVTLIFYLYKKNKEHYNLGTLIQLHAKGPQDTYLTGDAWKYIPPWYYNYGWAPFNNPTRFGRMNYYYYSPYGLNYYY